MNNFVFNMNIQCCNIIKHLLSHIYTISPIQLRDECRTTTFITTYVVWVSTLYSVKFVVWYNRLYFVTFSRTYKRFLTVYVTVPNDSAKITVLWTGRNLTTSLANCFPDCVWKYSISKSNSYSNKPSFHQAFSPYLMTV